MTTIATDGVTMSADQQITGGGTHLVGFTTKIFVAPNRDVIGMCGFSTDSERFKHFTMHGGERPELDGEFEALILTKDGNVFYIDHKYTSVRYLDVMALGSGGEMAIGAMLAGADTKRAVEIAITRDIRSGGKVETLRRGG